MAHLIWVYVEVVDEQISRTSLEMLSKADDVGTAEAIHLGAGPENALEELGHYGARKVYRSADSVFRDVLTLPAVETCATLIQKHQPSIVLFPSTHMFQISDFDVVGDLFKGVPQPIDELKRRKSAA